MTDPASIPVMPLKYRNGEDSITITVKAGRLVAVSATKGYGTATDVTDIADLDRVLRRLELFVDDAMTVNDLATVLLIGGARV